MRLTTKFSAFVTLLTGLTIFVTLIGCTLSFYNAIQFKFSHRVQAVATAIDTHLVTHDFKTLKPQINELMVSTDIVRVDFLQGKSWFIPRHVAAAIALLVQVISFGILLFYW